MGGRVVEHGKMCLCSHAPWGNSLREPLFVLFFCFFFCPLRLLPRFTGWYLRERVRRGPTAVKQGAGKICRRRSSTVQKKKKGCLDLILPIRPFKGVMQDLVFLKTYDTSREVNILLIHQISRVSAVGRTFRRLISALFSDNIVNIISHSEQLLHDGGR